MPSIDTGDETAQPEAQVPRLLDDPTWSIGLFTLEIDFLGKTFTIPAMPATDWLSYLMTPDAGLYEVTVNIFGELEEHLSDHFDKASITDLYMTVLEAIGVVCGRPWWVAIRMIRVVYDNWHVLGPKLIMSGVDPARLSISAWLDCALYLMIESMDPKDVSMFSLRLEMKPDLGDLEPESEKVDPFDALATTEDAFFAFGG